MKTIENVRKQKGIISDSNSVCGSHSEMPDMVKVRCGDDGEINGDRRGVDLGW